MADTAIKTFNIKKLIVTFAGQTVHGFASDEAISVEFPEDDFDVVAGADGEVTHVAKVRTDTKITINLAQSSSYNDVLSGIRTADKLTGAGVFPFKAIDGSGRTVIFAASARIIKAPTVAFGSTAKDRTWVLGTGPAEVFIGGN